MRVVTSVFRSAIGQGMSEPHTEAELELGLDALEALLLGHEKLTALEAERAAERAVDEELKNWRPNLEPDRSPMDGAVAARNAGIDVANLVYEKQLAYGDSSGLQFQFWHMALAKYRTSLVPDADTDSAGSYVLPVELLDHIPRLTRVMDRVFRVIGNPVADRLGENPWRDMAGDALCGIVMPRTKPEAEKRAAALEVQRARQEPRAAYSSELSPDIFSDPNERNSDRVAFKRETTPGTAQPGLAQNLRILEDPQPRDTRPWSEEPESLSVPEDEDDDVFF